MPISAAGSVTTTTTEAGPSRPEGGAGSTPGSRSREPEQRGARGSGERGGSPPTVSPRANAGGNSNAAAAAVAGAVASGAPVVVIPVSVETAGSEGGWRGGGIEDARSAEWMLTFGSRIEVIFVLSCLLGGVCKEQCQERLVSCGLVQRLGAVVGSVDWSASDDGPTDSTGNSIGQALRMQVRWGLEGGERRCGVNVKV